MKMLTLAMTMTLLTSGNAFTQTVNDTWQSIRKNKDLHIMQPQFAEAMGSDGLFNTCATDDEFKSLMPIRVCKEYDEVKCLRFEQEKVVISRTVQETYCKKHIPLSETNWGSCEEYGTRTIFLGKKYKLEVVQNTGKLYMHHLFNKTFTIPNCE